MSLDLDVINSLKSLPCFDEIQTIGLLANGLSQTAIKVTTASQTFFAKKLHQNTAITETYCALFCSNEDSEQGSTQHLSPDVIYYDHQWLVTAYICGGTLADSNAESDVKISTALQLMAKLHQLSTAGMREPIPTLDTKLSAERLLVKPAPLIAQNRHILDNVIKCLTCTINHLISDSTSPSVLCHGDINFTNILVDDEQQPWLIDFECAHIASIEFDLAMFFAVNNIPTQQLNEVVDNYIKLSPEYRCNKTLLNHYILYSFFINGLWYFDNTSGGSNTSDDNPDNHEAQRQNLFHQHAIDQWTAFDNFANEYAIDITKLLPLIG